jgi:hypothetical protein
MTELWFANLNILLKLHYCDVTIIDKFNYFIKVRLLLHNYDLRITYFIMTELWLANLNILLKLQYYDVTIVDKFYYFIKIRLLWQNYDLRI